MEQSRRTFIKKTAITTTALALGTPVVKGVSKDQKPISPNDKIRVGVIGCNGMGWSNMNSMLKNKVVDCVALCDVDENVLKRRSENVKEQRGNTPKLYKDYRQLIADKNIDAVIVGTPDHWHCLPMVESVQAGKHVYVEKPIANTIEECNLMVAAAKQSGKIVQVGQWQRSGTHYKAAIDIVRSGKLGNIRLVKVWAYQGWMKPVNKVADSAAPKGVDYDFWLGPAPRRTFNKNRFQHIHHLQKKLFAHTNASHRHQLKGQGKGQAFQGLGVLRVL